MEGLECKVAIVKVRVVSNCELILRLLALLLTLAATIVIGLNKQTTIIPATVSSNLPPLNVPVTAKWQHQPAFVYFMVANVVACTYAAISLILWIANKSGKRGLVLRIIVLDVMILALLFSANGAATSVGFLGYTGNSHVRWQKVCHAYGKFCGQTAASIALSLFGSLTFLLLLILALMGDHKILN